jgi:hypothetical protein
VVAKNALTHGLTANRPATAGEAAMAESLRSALLAQYPSSNPLVQLQIDRIARVAAKLQRLQQIEEAAFELAQQDALPPTQAIVAGMGHADEAAQQEAVRILQGCSPKLTLGLDDAALAVLCNEIRAKGQAVRTMADVNVVLPKTYAFVNAQSDQLGTKGAGLQLQALVASLHPAPPVELPDKPIISIPDAELIAHMNSQAARKNSDTVMVRVRPKNDPAAVAQGLQNDLQAILDLHLHRQAVQELVQRYPARRALLLQVAMPPQEEADRLMRYQVAMDRQLSKCMGELLQINAMN